jgi:hypothetical protein
MRTKTKRGRTHPTLDEIAAVEEEGRQARTLDGRTSAEGVKRAELFRIQDPEDSARYHEIINNQDQYTVLDSDHTWDKDKGSTIGLTIFLFYVDRFAEKK